MSTEIELVPFALGDGSGVMVCCADDAMAIIAQRDARIAELEAYYNEACDDAMGVAREIAALKSQPSAQEWPQQECPVTGAITDVDPADMGAQQSSAGVVLPDDRELLDFAVSEQFLLFCDEEEFLDIAKSVLSKLGRLNPCRAQSVPDVLFDGFAVYSALDAKAQGRTSPENVSDALDAAVRLIRAAAPSAQQKESGDE